MNKWLAVSVACLFAIAFSAVSASATVCSTVAACVLGANMGIGTGVEGQSQRSFGVFGISKLNHGIDGQSTSSFGVVGITSANAISAGTARAGVLGEDGSMNKNILNSGVAGTSKYAIGVSGTGGVYGGYFLGGSGVFTSGLGADPDRITINNPFGVTDSQSNGAIRAYGVYDDGGALPFPPELLFAGVGCFITPYMPLPGQNGCGPTSAIYSDGTASFAGAVSTGGTTSIRTKRTNSSTAVISYGARTSMPTLEDFGQASLVHGAAHVVLESMFASTIDPHAYMVFITPLGDSHGLYATAITPAGFDVRENQGGRSSLTFSYRIVAHPIDTKLARLPLAKPMQPLRAPARRVAKDK